MSKFYLDGKWNLFCIFPDGHETCPMECQVPGNIELALVEAGLEKDPYIGANARNFRKYEYCDFRYEHDFEAEPGEASLVFDGLDCYGDIYLNGSHVGECANALIPHSFKVNLQEHNHLEVIIHSADRRVRELPDEAAAFPHFTWERTGLWTRKPAHSLGWDIAPRLMLGGLWRSVHYDRLTQDAEFNELWVETLKLGKDGARLRFHYDFKTSLAMLDDVNIRLEARCKESCIVIEQPVFFTRGAIDISVANPILWWPAGSGEPSLYNMRCTLHRDGHVLAEGTGHFGIRTVELLRTDLDLASEGYFYFKINGEKVRIRGANHVPLDAFHSRDPQRMDAVLALFEDLGCNMLRVWGGGVYESDEFYDWCDRHGILVWQDFMLGCHAYPQHPRFLEMIRIEAESAVRRLRQHCSIALWCGDNECDQFYINVGAGNPNKNKINRQVLPDVVSRLDPLREYLPSSPYVSEKAWNLIQDGRVYDIIPERHLWGSRETFKLPFYSRKYKFISETGWHGCPSRSSMEKFLTPEHMVLEPDDKEWKVHASSPFDGYSYMEARNRLMKLQLEEYFTEKIEGLDDFILASQIHQAEAFKFMVEQARLDAECGGILWWNVIDCWPQFSDSVVDWYFNRKLAYWYLKRSQRDFCICCSETSSWKSRICAINDTREIVKGSYSLACDGEILLAGEFCVEAGGILELGQLRSPRAVNSLWLISWNANGKAGANHYISGNRVMSFEWYRRQLPKIAALDDMFDANKIGK